MYNELCIIRVLSAMNTGRLIIPDEPHPALPMGKSVARSVFRHALLDHLDAKDASIMTKSIQHQGRFMQSDECSQTPKVAL